MSQNLNSGNLDLQLQQNRSRNVEARRVTLEKENPSQRLNSEEMANVSQQKLTGLVKAPCPICKCESAVAENTVADYSLEKCTKCGFVFMNPRCLPQHLDEIYRVRDEEELAALYESLITPSKIAKQAKALHSVGQLLPEKGRLLDFGCGAGHLVEQAQELGWEAHGCDVGEWIETASSNRNIDNIHVGNLDEIAFPNDHFDAAISMQVFEHLLEPLEDLAQLIRVVRPGGIVYINVPNYHTIPIMLGKDDFMLNEPPQHVNYFAPATIRRLFKEAGLTQVQVRTGDGMKWENLFGNPIQSETAQAYGLVEAKPAAAKQSEKKGNPSLSSKCRSLAKAAIMKTMVEPVFYRGMKVGMSLVAIGVKR